MLVEEKTKKEIEDKYKLERKIEKEKEAPFIKELNGYLIKDFLSAEEQYALNLSEKLSKSSYLNFKAIFVKKWLSAKVKAEVIFNICYPNKQNIHRNSKSWKWENSNAC